MSSIRKRGKRWRAEVRKGGVAESRTFASKIEAERWAIGLEAEIVSGKTGETPRKTFGELLERYGKEVSTTKRGSKWELARIGAIQAIPLAQTMIGDLEGRHFSAWRDARLRDVSGATVRREMTLLNHALNISVREWNWLTENPMAHIKRPADSKARDRRISADEIERICLAAGYERDQTPGTLTARVAAAFLFAIETAMRVSEIIRLEWKHIDIDQRTAHLPTSKNGSSRDVALSREAVRLLEQLPKVGQQAFGLSSTSSTDTLFRKIKDRASIEELHFHDTRHEAITRLAKKLDVLPLARMVGHRNIKELMTYYNATAAEIAERLD